ncbi:MAG: glycosyltransferase family 2 protein [Clostridia bacterium]
MKLLTIAIPCYNSQDYLAHAVESALLGGNEVEVLIVDDGSKDDTARIADAYERKYPQIVRAIHQENGGHGDAVMTGIRNATGLYFKVVDSDDWLDAEAYPKVLSALRDLSAPEKQIDLLISNYVYDKVGVKHKHVVGYGNALPESCVLSWSNVSRFRVGQYILMHAAIYRTKMLRECGLNLPKHTFYVDSLYVYTPMPHVSKLYYLNVNFYHYFIGREDQSVQEQVMIRRIDQQFRVNRMMSEAVDLSKLQNKALRCYMRNYLEIITTVSTVLSIKSGNAETLRQSHELWAMLKKETPHNYRLIRHRALSVACHLPGRLGRHMVMRLYHISRRIYGFN